MVLLREEIPDRDENLRGSNPTSDFILNREYPPRERSPEGNQFLIWEDRPDAEQSVDGTIKPVTGIESRTG